jgi:hypothetical protein
MGRFLDRYDRLEDGEGIKKINAWAVAEKKVLGFPRPLSGRRLGILDKNRMTANPQINWGA